MDHRIPIYLLTLIIAIASAPIKAATTLTNIYRVSSWDLSTTAQSWRQRLTSALRACAHALWGHRQGLAYAALIAWMVLAPHTAAAHGLAIIGIAGTLNIDAMETDLLKITGEAATLFETTAKTCQAYEEKNEKGEVTVKGRLFTAEEKKAVQDIIDRGNALKARIASAKGDANLSAEIERLTAGMTVAKPAAGPTRHAVQSLGQQWAASPAGQFFFKKLHQGSRNWSSPVAELFDLRAATLTTDSASGGDLIVTDTRPGILQLLFKRLTVRDLLAPGRTDSNSVTYMKETTFTNAAATVAQGAAKPESTLIFDRVVDMVEKIAHWLPVTEEMLEDVSQIKSYIDARLRLGVDMTEEDQLLNGDGTTPNISGILDRVGLTPTELRAGAVTNEDAIFIEMMKIFNASFVMPDAHVLNPGNWQTIQLRKDTTGRYIGSGPFAGPQPPTLWGLPVAVTPSIALATGLTGSFRSSAQIFDHGNLRVEASNSHSDFFIKNLVAIRAEERLALAVYRPAAFGTTTGLT